MVARDLSGRPAVDVVVPFVGTDEELAELREKLGALELVPHDTLTIVDNRPGSDGAASTDCVLRAPDVSSSYYARNRGARRGRSPWIVFLDADIELEPGLLTAYFDPPPAPETGQLIGAIEPFAAGAGRIERYGVLRRHLSHEVVGEQGAEVGLTANVAVRRAAFEGVDGFADRIRSGGDADLSFRLREAGWRIEMRPAARVRHATRARLGTMLRVFMRYGSGAELDPPSAPALLSPCADVEGGSLDRFRRGSHPVRCAPGPRRGGRRPRAGSRGGPRVRSGPSGPQRARRRCAQPRAASAHDDRGESQALRRMIHAG